MLCWKFFRWIRCWTMALWWQKFPSWLLVCQQLLAAIETKNWLQATTPNEHWTDRPGQNIAQHRAWALSWNYVLHRTWETLFYATRERCWAKGAWLTGQPVAALENFCHQLSSAQLSSARWWSLMGNVGWLAFIFGNVGSSFYIWLGLFFLRLHTHRESHIYIYAWLLAYARNGSQHAENSVISFMFGRSVDASLVGYWKIWAKYEMLLKCKFYKISVGLS